MGDTDPRQAVAAADRAAGGDRRRPAGVCPSEGIGHVQLVVDPITEASVAALAPVLEALDAGLTRRHRAARRDGPPVVRVAC